MGYGVARASVQNTPKDQKLLPARRILVAKGQTYYFPEILAKNPFENIISNKNSVRNAIP